ncbi:MAG: septum site-determining protein MinC [Cyanobacteria bacterium NC_groundwater_1444_Ag_S-0.65um_54_12]|nr:septum site-determining protein MinC [Cyanobacteria bacterium NC_groundwater_1444_Ag_S-0.65um_54_12]
MIDSESSEDLVSETCNSATVDDIATIRFKGWRGGFLIIISPEPPWSIAMQALQERMQVAREFWESAHVMIDLGDRELSNGELDMLFADLTTGFDLQLDGIISKVAKVREHACKHYLEVYEELLAVPAKTSSSPEPAARYLKGPVRSGMVVEAPGNVVIIGDVNAGAEIRAGGDIVVFGTLRGMAHAGCAGDLTARILAINLRPTQLRIGELIARAPDGMQPPPSKNPEVATVEDGEIHICPL